MSEFVNNTIFWVEVEKIHPNPYQPRKEFDERHLGDLADSIRMYGILQPLTVTRKEHIVEGGGMTVEYELIAGERRLRASKLAGLTQVPVLIQQGFVDPKLKLELAIIENLQREDLNPVDRALSFARLANEFSLKHAEIAKKVGKSREYVSNSLRLLALPQDIMTALQTGKISEGHARPLLMLNDRQAEQSTLFKEIIWKKLTVREAEQVARHVAKEKTRKKTNIDPKLTRMEAELAESLGTRVHIEPKEKGGRLVIDFFAAEDVQALIDRISARNALLDARALREGIMSTGKREMEHISAATPIHFEASPAPVAPVLEPIAVASAAQSFPPYGTYHREGTVNAEETQLPQAFHESPQPQYAETPQYVEEQPTYPQSDSVSEAIAEVVPGELLHGSEIEVPIDDRSAHEQRESLDSDEDLYSVTGFNI
jgi:ParB family chromosome partitioning protein